MYHSKVIEVVLRMIGEALLISRIMLAMIISSFNMLA
jgi:hypothetical protein